jgi:DNA-binding response OmpR family regulator
MTCIRCEELEEKVRQLEHVLYAKDYVPPRELRLSMTQTSMLGVLLRHDRVVSCETLFEATRNNRTNVTEPDVKLMQVQMFRLREKIRPFRLVIDTVRGVGFRLNPETRLRLLNWPAEQSAAA